MNTYEVTKSDGTTVTLTASGYSWDKPDNAIAFYDADSNKVASYRAGEWISLHMRSALVKSEQIKPTAIASGEFSKYYGL